MTFQDLSFPETDGFSFSYTLHWYIYLCLALIHRYLSETAWIIFHCSGYTISGSPSISTYAIPTFLLKSRVQVAMLNSFSWDPVQVLYSWFSYRAKLVRKCLLIVTIAVVISLLTFCICSKVFTATSFAEQKFEIVHLSVEFSPNI